MGNCSRAAGGSGDTAVASGLGSLPIARGDCGPWALTVAMRGAEVQSASFFLAVHTRLLRGMTRWSIAPQRAASMSAHCSPVQRAVHACDVRL